MFTNILNKLSPFRYPFTFQRKYLEFYCKKYPLVGRDSSIDIVIPILDRLNVTKLTLNLLAQRMKSNYKIKIFDNGSSQDTVKFLKNIESENINIFYSEDNKGASFARNYWLQKSNSEYIAFLDNDILIMPGYFENMIKILESDSNLIGVQSLVVGPDMKIQLLEPQFFETDSEIVFMETFYMKNFKEGFFTVPRRIGWIGIGATLWKTNKLKQIGFNEDFYTNYEDNDLSIRAKKEGHLFSNSPKSVALHLSQKFVPSDSKKYIEDRFGTHNARKSAKLFFQSHKKFFYFGDREGFIKYLGFNTVEEYKNFILS